MVIGVDEAALGAFQVLGCKGVRDAAELQLRVGVKGRGGEGDESVPAGLQGDGLECEEGLERGAGEEVGVVD